MINYQVLFLFFIFHKSCERIWYKKYICYCFMKGFILLLICIFFPLYTVSASDKIQLSVDRTQWVVGERFFIEISLSWVQAGEIELPGIENFDIISQSQSSSFQSINGKQSQSSSYQIILQAYTEGNFTLGPVRISDTNTEIIDDETYTLQIGTMVSQNIHTAQIPNTKKQQNTDIPQSSMQQEKLWDTLLRPLRLERFPLIVSIAWVFVFLSGFYTLLYLYFVQKKDVLDTSLKNKKIMLYQKTEEEEYIRLIQELEKKIPQYSKKEFYARLHHILRNYFHHLGLMHAKTSSLKELQQEELWAYPELFDIFRRTYTNEYSKIAWWSSYREEAQKYIEELISYLSSVSLSQKTHHKKDT